MVDNIVIGKSLRVNGSKPLDYLYGPYESTEALKRNIPTVLRYKGLTGAVIDQYTGDTTEYWFKSGIKDEDLVIKFSSSGGSSSDPEFNIISIVYPKILNTNNRQVSIEVVTTLTSNSIQIKRNGTPIYSSTNISQLDYVDNIPAELLVEGTTIRYTIEAIRNNIPRSTTKTVIVSSGGGGDIPVIKPTVNLSWSANKYTTYIGTQFTPNYPRLIGGEGLNINYSSSNSSIATISNDGTINAIAPGTVIISAYFAGNDVYQESNIATYTLTVAQDSVSSISINATVSPTRITIEQTSTVNIKGIIVRYASGYSTQVSKENVTINVTGGTLNGNVFTPNQIGTAYITVQYQSKTAQLSIVVTEPEIPKKTVQVGHGTTYASATFIDTGEQLTNNMIVSINNALGDYIFIKVDKTDTIINFYTYNSDPQWEFEIDLNSPIEDGDYKYYQTQIQFRAGEIYYKINKN